MYFFIKTCMHLAVLFLQIKHSLFHLVNLENICIDLAIDIVLLFLSFVKGREKLVLGPLVC